MRKTSLLDLLYLPYCLLFCLSVNAQLGLEKCSLKTYEELRAMGYEPVRAHNVVGDGITDDTAAIQEAINTANASRKAVYFHPGTYLVSKTLIVEQNLFVSGFGFTNENNNMTRYGNKLVGSYCGNEKPVIKLQDNLQAASSINVDDPFSVIKLFRRNASDPTNPNSRDDSRSWNTSIHNLTIDLGTNNPGAVGINQQGAEGCSSQEVTILANDSFAGFYNLNSSGGYTYNVEVIGGNHGIYLNSSRGGSVLVVGLKLSGQKASPIAVTNYVPFGLVGFDITCNQGGVISHINGGKLTYSNSSHDAATQIYLIDGKINISGSGTDAIIDNDDRSIYLKNIYTKGRTNIHTYTTHIDNPDPLGKLTAANASNWSLINEYSFTPGLYVEEGHLLQGLNTNNSFYSSDLYDPSIDISNYLFSPSENIIVSTEADPPSDLISIHTHDIGLLNPEGNNIVSVVDYGANPNDNVDDAQNIQDAIDAAGDNGIVFLPAGKLYDDNGTECLGYYKINQTIKLKRNTVLFGVSRYNSVLAANDWSNPSENSPVISTINDANAAPVIADFKIIIPPVAATGNYNGIIPEFENHIYSILWQSGEHSIYKDVFTQNMYGPLGDRKVHIISGNGGGKWYGITQAGSYPPCAVNPGNCNNSTANNSFFDSYGNYVSHPDSRKMLVEGTSQKLSFYPYHCQHDTPVNGALWEIKDASNVNVYGIKSEMGSIPERMMVIIKDNPSNLVPVWLFIKNSSNISLVGHEGLSQTAQDRGLIEITEDSYNITIASMGRRGAGLLPNNTELNQDSWYFVKETTQENFISKVTAQGFLSLFKSGKIEPSSNNEDTTDSGTITIVPNPAKDSLNISSGIVEIDSISIFNLSGQQVLTKKVNSLETTLSLAGISSGMYVVKVYTKDGSKGFKVVKK
tara:strand:- start:201 stop:2936 length:2736 start_codon:yes stop_codon:yes gene_type:complete